MTAEIAHAKGIADGLQFACRLPDKKPDFTACGGPAAEAYWEHFTPTRIVSLLAAIEALSAALRTHRHKLTDTKGEFCAGCLEPWPCPDPEAIITGALGGTQLSKDENHG
jgi:hypothetical protein